LPGLRAPALPPPPGTIVAARPDATRSNCQPVSLALAEGNEADRPFPSLPPPTSGTVTKAARGTCTGYWPPTG